MEAKSLNPHPRRVLLGPLRTPTQIRGALRRLGQAVADGKLEPKRANAAIFAVSGAAKMLELEMAAGMQRQLKELQRQPLPSHPALIHENIVDAEMLG